MSSQTLFTVIAFNSLVLFLPLAAILLWLRPTLWMHLFTLFLGIVVGLIDLRNSEPQFAALLLLVFGLFAGFAQPRRAWLWALLLGLWVPILALVTYTLHLSNATSTEAVSSIIALIPAFVGAYAGVIVKRFAATGESVENRA